MHSICLLPWPKPRCVVYVWPLIRGIGGCNGSVALDCAWALGSPVRLCSGSVRRGSTPGTYSTPRASCAHRPVSTGARLQRSRSPQAPARVAVVPTMFLCHPSADCPTCPLFMSSCFARLAGVEAVMGRRERSGRHRNTDAGVGRAVLVGHQPRTRPG